MPTVSRQAAVVTAGLGLLACGCTHQPVSSPTAGAHGAPAAITTSTAPPLPTVIAPLTGLAVPVSPADNRPALSVKIGNQAGAMPQSGLDRADLVTEALVEGGLTRLLATFQSEDAPRVGPIRSARPVDGPLLRELGGGIFAYSGAAAGEIAPVKATSTATLLSYGAGLGVFERLTGRAAPDDVVASTAGLEQAGLRAGARRAPPPQLFTYAASGATPASGAAVAAAPGAEPASRVSVVMSPQSSAAWAWDRASRAWQRNQDGSPDVLAGGARVTAANVVVMSVAIGHTGIFDSLHHEDPLVEVVGSGPCWVLRDGTVMVGTWQRPSLDTSLRLVDASGGVIPLAPGRTWIELQPRPYRPSLGPPGPGRTSP